MKLIRAMMWTGSMALLGIASACSPATPEPTATPLPAATISPSPIIRATPSASTSAPTLAQATRPLQTATPAPKDLLLTALNGALAKIKTYRVTVPEEGRLMEIVLPDRVRQLANEPITKIASTYWQFAANGEQRAQQVGPVAFMDRANLLWLRDQISKSTSSASLGAATLDGAQNIGYSITLPLVRIGPPKTPGGAPETTQFSEIVKVWFGVTDGFPHRVEYGAPISVTVNFFDYNSNIEINPP